VATEQKADPRVAALYVDTKRGPYPRLPGVTCWGVDEDATKYCGPYPVVAHPPCGHWGSYRHRCADDGRTGPVAVGQVRAFGGVLEHPRNSRLWKELDMPRPGEGPDWWGGWTLEVRQCDWGHPAEKRTWLYIVGTRVVPPMPPRVEPRPAPPKGRNGRQTRGWLEMLPKSQRHLTPPGFALWLAELARGCA
jgi:hypothetical protein